MKKILITALLLVGITATAQVKVGSNPTTIDTGTTNFQVEGTTTAQQFVVLKNGNIGIGTTVPGNILSIKKDAPGTQSVFFQNLQNDATSMARMVTMAYGSGSIGIESYSSSYTGTGIRKSYSNAIYSSGYSLGIGVNNPGGVYPTSYISFFTNGDAAINERMRIEANGNVGIGTTAPTEKLDVTGSIKMVDGNQAAGAFMVSDANGKATWTPAATALGASASKWTNDAANTRVALTNLSDGTTARPAEKSLFVHDRGSVTINSQRSDFVNDASSLGLGVFDNEITFTASSATAVNRNGIYEYSPLNIASGVTLTGVNQFQGTRSDMIRVGSTNAGSFNGFAKAFQATYGHHSSVNTASTSETIVGFYARPYSQKGTITNLYDFYADNLYELGGTVTNRYGIGIDGDTKKNYFMGSVGIGTNNPLNKLHIEGSGIMARLASTSAIGNNYMLFTNNGVNSGYMGYGGSATEHLTLMNITTTGNVVLGTQNSQRLVVAADGKIGIGTNTPADILHLAIAGGTATTQGIRITQPGFTSQAGFMNFSTANQNLQVGTTGSTMGVSFFTNNIERMRIVGNNGNVGIGTTSPTAPLHINSSGSGNKFFITNGTNTEIRAFFQITGTDDGLFALRNASNANMVRLIANGASFINGGNVGIGTDTPTSKLHVVGLPVHVDNAAAITAGLTAGAFYHAGDGIVRVVF